MRRKGKHKVFESDPIFMSSDGCIYGDIEQLPTIDDFRDRVIASFLFDINTEHVEVWYCGLRMAEGKHLWVFDKKKRNGMFPVWRLRNEIQETH